MTNLPSPHFAITEWTLGLATQVKKIPLRHILLPYEQNENKVRPFAPNPLQLVKFRTVRSDKNKTNSTPSQQVKFLRQAPCHSSLTSSIYTNLPTTITIITTTLLFLLPSKTLSLVLLALAPLSLPFFSVERNNLHQERPRRIFTVTRGAKHTYLALTLPLPVALYILSSKTKFNSS